VKIRSNADWLAALRSPGPAQETALEELREYLLRAVYVYLSKHRSDLAYFDTEELQQLSQDWAQEALLLILDKLDSFRGDSRFTTWAYRVVINLAAGELRRRRWSVTSLESMTEEAERDVMDYLVEDEAAGPEKVLEQRQLWDTLRQVIDEELTERQRAVLVGAVFRGEPAEALAHQLGTNRNNIYKIMHDARKKLKQKLLQRGLTEEVVLAAFS
jgi:RNA polymerase sigma-70 factor (ECF subfamily)